MSDLQKYLAKRKKRDPRFAKVLEVGYQGFKLGLILRMAREEAGVTLEALAEKLGMKKSAISRIEDHANEVRLSTLYRYADALGKVLRVEITE